MVGFGVAELSSRKITSRAMPQRLDISAKLKPSFSRSAFRDAKILANSARLAFAACNLPYPSASNSGFSASICSHRIFNSASRFEELLRMIRFGLGSNFLDHSGNPQSNSYAVIGSTVISSMNS